VGNVGIDDDKATCLNGKGGAVQQKRTFSVCEKENLGKIMGVRLIIPLPFAFNMMDIEHFKIQML
jgi:hypothetical protein